jgi:CheY-like chemotaxis protein
VVPGEYARIVVTDTGTGIDPVTIARVFEPFFTTKDVGKGTGLGLSTVFGIVQRAGGSIWVASEVGAGTSFTIYLPRSEDASAPFAAPPPTPSARGTETVLIAEDEPQVRMVAAGILRRAGYQVLVAESADDAIRIAGEHAGPIDLLISDVVMPQMSGTELARRLSALRPEIAVLLMSGYTDDTNERHGVGTEGAFLQKPLTPESLRSKVRQALATRGIVRPA